VYLPGHSPPARGSEGKAGWKGECSCNQIRVAPAFILPPPFRPLV
jgi:hypothetical protein